MRATLLGLALLAFSATAAAADVVYEGTWLTTNRKLDGILTCTVTDLGNNKWRGHFSGEWQGVRFSYTVPFSGPPDKLHGTAVIDGADYQWTGTMTTGPAGAFKGSFTGSRYVGGFSLKQRNN